MTNSGRTWPALLRSGSAGFLADAENGGGLQGRCRHPGARSPSGPAGSSPAAAGGIQGGGWLALVAPDSRVARGADANPTNSQWFRLFKNLRLPPEREPDYCPPE